MKQTEMVDEGEEKPDEPKRIKKVQFNPSDPEFEENLINLKQSMKDTKEQIG